MKKIYSLKTSCFIALFLLVFVFNSHAQVPTTQDCLGAIPVCDYIYTEEFTASGEGNYTHEIPSSGNNCPTHCMAGEKNTRWYTWTVIRSGDLRLVITPSTASDDYDWAVFNISEYSCDDIYNNSVGMMASCNAAGGTGYHGPTGISTFMGGTQNCNNGGETNKWSVDLPVFEGESYVLVVSDWTMSPGGYTLDFSSSTATIFDDFQPYLANVAGDEITACGTNEVHITFNENVKCNSISESDFSLSGPGGPYVLDSIFGQNCSIGGNNERDFYLYCTPPIYQSGEYILEIKDNSFISDPCNNYTLPDVFTFSVELDAPTANAGNDIDIAYAASATLDGSGEGGSGDYSFHWEPADLLDDADVQFPTTINLVNSTEFTLELDDNISNCKSVDVMMVNVVGGPLSLMATVDKPEICLGEMVNLNASPDGGSGNYSYAWTSVPVGFTSNQQSPSDFSVQDITYYVEVTDGFTTLNANVSVVVNAKPIADAGEDIEIELGNTTTLLGNANGGTGNYLYHWEPASWLEENEEQSPLTLLLPETTLFTLIATDANSGCESEIDEMHVIVSSDILSANPFADPQTICSGHSSTISAIPSGGGGGYEYAWTSNPSGFISSESEFVVSPTVSTRYDLILTDQFGNEFSGHINVEVNPSPIINLIPDGASIYGNDTISACISDSVWLDAGFNDDPFGTTYFWTKDNYENRYFKAQTSGTWIDIQTHKVIVEHGITGCVDSSEITIFFDYNECEISVPENSIGLEEAISILPNPNNGNFTLNINKSISDLSLKVYDIRGGLIYETVMEGKYEKNYNHQIDSGINEKGVYLLVLQTGGEWFLQKMVVN
jgi:hypothetical protein